MLLFVAKVLECQGRIQHWRSLLKVVVHKFIRKNLEKLKEVKILKYRVCPSVTIPSRSVRQEKEWGIVIQHLVI